MQTEMLSLIAKVESARDSFIKAKEKICASNNTWDKKTDARITLFSKSINVLNDVQIGMILIHYHLSRKDWWKLIATDSIPENDIQIYLAEFIMFVKMGFLQFLFSSIESSFRLILKALDPNACSGGTAEFKNIYSSLLARLGLGKWEPLLDLLRNTRNTIHNNGVYFHRAGRNEAVVYNGKTYSFVIGRPVDFVTWDFMLELLSELKKLFIEVVSHPDVSQITTIEDPFVT